MGKGLADRVSVLFCYSYDPTHGTYRSLGVINLVRVFGVLTMIGMGLTFVVAAAQGEAAAGTARGGGGMIAQLQFLPEQASDGAAKVDALYFFLIAVSGFFTILIATLVITFAIRYRRRGDEIPHRITGSMRLEVAWSILPLVIGLVIFGLGASTYFAMSRPPDDALEIHVVGKQWMWKLQHPDGQAGDQRATRPRGASGAG